MRAVKLKYSKMCEGLRHNCRSPCFSRIFISGRGEKLVGWLVENGYTDKLFSSKRKKLIGVTKMECDPGNSETSFSSRANNLIIVLESGIILDYTFEISRILY